MAASSVLPLAHATPLSVDWPPCAGVQKGLFWQGLLWQGFSCQHHSGLFLKALCLKICSTRSSMSFKFSAKMSRLSKKKRIVFFGVFLFCLFVCVFFSCLLLFAVTWPAQHWHMSKWRPFCVYCAVLNHATWFVFLPKSVFPSVVWVCSLWNGIGIYAGRYTVLPNTYVFAGPLTGIYAGFVGSVTWNYAGFVRPITRNMLVLSDQ